MASTSAIMSLTPRTLATTHNKFFNPLAVKVSSVGSKTAQSLQVRASMKEKAVVAGLSAAMTASMVIPEVAEAASGVCSVSQQAALCYLQLLGLY